MARRVDVSKPVAGSAARSQCQTRSELVGGYRSTSSRHAQTQSQRFLYHGESLKWLSSSICFILSAFTKSWSVPTMERPHGGCGGSSRWQCSFLWRSHRIIASLVIKTLIRTCLAVDSRNLLKGLGLILLNRVVKFKRKMVRDTPSRRQKTDFIRRVGMEDQPCYFSIISPYPPLRRRHFSSLIHSMSIRAQIK